MTHTPHLTWNLEDAAVRLANEIGRLGDDPFVPLVLAVGHYAQVPWLRHMVATERGLAAGWQILPLGAALDAATRCVLQEEGCDDVTWWESTPKKADAWLPEVMRQRVLEAFRVLAMKPGCEPLRDYLYGGESSGGRGVVWRELALAEEVALVLERLMRQRWDTALRWAEDPEAEPVEGDQPAPAWFRQVCAHLELASPASPCTLRRRLASGEGKQLNGPPLVVVGHAVLSPGEATLMHALRDLVPVREIRRVCCPVRWGEAPRTEVRSPLLRSFGRSEERELKRIGDVDAAAAPPASDVSWLARLQTSALHDKEIEPGSWGGKGPEEDSVTIHGCHGAMRQVELIRDTLLRWFAADHGLEPRDVLLLTPELEKHAALVEWVFSRKDAADSQRRMGQEQAAEEKSEGEEEREHAPTIPVAISDLGLARTNPVAESLLSVLALCDERVDAPRLYSFIGLEPVRLRFGFSLEDASDLRALLVESGMRWGLDGPDRARPEDGQPDRHQNTVEFGLERLALGALMPDEGLEEGIPHDELGPLVPRPVEGRDRARRVAQLTAICRSLRQARDNLKAEPRRTAAAWFKHLSGLLDDFTETSDAQAWLRVQTEEALAEALPETKEGGDDLMLDLRAVRRLVCQRFEIPQRGGRVLTGAVEVRQLGLDVATPRRVVILLGMDHGVFPCSPRPREWDPFAQRAPGEHDPRDLDRLAMLQAMLCAGQRLVITYSAHDLIKGEELPPCVPVGELRDILCRATGLKREDLVQSHTRQPWSRRDLGAELLDRSTLEAATAVAPIQDGEAEPVAVGLAVGRDKPLPPEEHPITDLELDRLAADLVNPAKFFLYRRVGVFLEEQEAEIEDREPIEPSALGAWSMRNETMRLLNRGEGEPAATAKDLLNRLAGKGELPLQAGGDAMVTELLDEVELMRETYDRVKGQVVEEGDWRVELGCGLKLAGEADRVRELDGSLLLEWLVPGSTDSPKRAMKAWAHLLAARHNNEHVVGARMVGAKANVLWLAAPGSKDEARARLTELGEAWRRGRRQPLYLFPKSSWELAKMLASKDPAELKDPAFRRKAAGAVRPKWFGVPMSEGDIQDRWIAELFADYDPARALEEDPDPASNPFIDLAVKVYCPVVVAKNGRSKEIKALKGQWESKEGDA